MEFKKYNSIENSYQDDFLSSIIEQGFGEQEYLVQEKVHVIARRVRNFTSDVRSWICG